MAGSRGRGGGFDPVKNHARLKAVADAAGRDMTALSISVSGAPADAEVLDRYREAGIDRALLILPSAGEDEVLPVLDRYAQLL